MLGLGRGLGLGAVRDPAHLGRVDAQMSDDRADLSDVAHALAVLVEERKGVLDHLLHLQRARRLTVPIAVPTRS